MVPTSAVGRLTLEALSAAPASTNAAPLDDDGGALDDDSTEVSAPCRSRPRAGTIPRKAGFQVEHEERDFCVGSWAS